MTSQEFVEILRERVVRSTAKSVIENVEAPPGNPPADRWQGVNLWYQQLNANDKNELKFLIHEAAKETVFAFLCILDGVRAVSQEQAPPVNGEFVLEFRTDQNSSRLNTGWIDGPFLHDLL